MRKVLPAIGLAMILGHGASAETQTAEACGRLAALRIGAADITLPTTGAEVTSAAPVNDANGSYCRILGAIRPVDPTAPSILFQANLPANWNGKALQFGGAAIMAASQTPRALRCTGLPGRRRHWRGAS
jgi:hypothetical protein